MSFGRAGFPELLQSSPSKCTKLQSKHSADRPECDAKSLSKNELWEGRFPRVTTKFTMQVHKIIIQTLSRQTWMWCQALWILSRHYKFLPTAGEEIELPHLQRNTELLWYTCVRWVGLAVAVILLALKLVNSQPILCMIFFNVGSNHPTFKLQRTRIWNKQFAVYISDKTDLQSRSMS